ncbi:hypothetical protein [Clostridium brassicae]|uniref:Uncharacterized protein n=1 Tax=Clostridium brassicae TaxID=2999072 RepID=A0ABT4DCQ9_9CLOT|nr:hypothetical protein [Clostridium brassicae]MCY6960100.1 hypothetical protein [Clostridium brassicae]
MMAVYGLLKLDKQVIPVYEGQYDVRVLMNAVKTMMGNREISIDKMIGKLLMNTGLK